MSAATLTAGDTETATGDTGAARNGLTTPITCRRCSGTGFIENTRMVYAGFPGTCFACAGHGVVEGDRVTIAAAKARAEAVRAIITWAIDTAIERGMPRHRALTLSYGIDHLATHAPQRYEAALDSYRNNHPHLFVALIIYTAEAGYFHYGATAMTVTQALAEVGATEQPR
jgi:hypothetical protein